MDQLRKENYVPLIIMVGFSVLMFGLMALPHSQYALLSEMTLLNTETNGTANLNWGTIIPGMLSLMNVIFLCCVVVIGALGFIMNRFYNYHFLMRILIVLATLQGLTQLAYLITGFNGVFDTGDKVILVPNIIVSILNVLYLIPTYITYILFVEKPYQEVKKLVYEETQKDIAEEKEHQKTVSQAQDVVSDAKDDMRKMILTMVSEGKISPDEANKLLNEINNK